MAFTADDATKLISILPDALDLYASFTTVLAATKGETPTARDFDILIALAPKLKSLALKIEADLATTPVV